MIFYTHNLSLFLFNDDHGAKEEEEELVVNNDNSAMINVNE
jgi:hypothetical protein